MINAKTSPKTKQALTMPAILLRLEGLTVLLASLAFYAYQNYNWLAFGLLLLAPDLVFIVYAFNKKAGIISYNLAHTYIFPALLLGYALLVGLEPGIQIALIWLAHIGLDRVVGYGLKYQGDFKDTHLHRV